MDPTPFPSDPLPAPRPPPYFILIPIAFIIGMFTGYFIRGESIANRTAVAERSSAAAQSTAQAESSSAAPTSDPAQQAAAADDGERRVVRYDVPIDDDPVLGPEDAPITIIEFSDYECPFCKRWHDESFERLIETFPDEIRFVYRDFPLTNIHPNAVPAAEAANCAHEQGQFWDFHRKLFSTTTLNTQTYMAYAEELGLDMPAFEECFTSRRYQDEVMADLEWAVNLGISSTPTFFINGIAIVGAQPFDLFHEVITKELAGEIP
jgi:protein-disulfide isomerase